MKKNIIMLVVLLVVLAGSVSALLLLNRTPASSGDDSAAQDAFTYVLGSVDPPFVKQVIIQNQSGSFTIANRFENAQEQIADPAQNAYIIEGIDSEFLNPSLLKTVMASCASLVSIRNFEAVSDLSVYGLSTPRATVEAVYDSGIGKIQIGDESPGGEGIYVLSEGQVYLVSKRDINNMLLSKYDFVDKTVTPGNAQTSAFQTMVLLGKNYSQPITIEASEPTQASTMLGTGSYTILSPEQSALDTTTALPALNAVFGITATAVVGETADLALFGLADPYQSVRVESSDPEIGMFTLLISDPAADGSVYLYSSNKPFVFMASADSLPWIDLSLFDLREKMILLPFIDNLSQIEIYDGAAIYPFAFSGEGDTLKVSCGDITEINTKNFRQFYQTLIAARYESEISAADKASDTEISELEAETPEILSEQNKSLLLQYTYHYRDNSSPDIVRFYQGPARKVIVTLNDGPEYYTQSIYVDRVLEDLQKVLSGIDVKSYY